VFGKSEAIRFFLRANGIAFKELGEEIPRTSIVAYFVIVTLTCGCWMMVETSSAERRPSLGRLYRDPLGNSWSLCASSAGFHDLQNHPADFGRACFQSSFPGNLRRTSLQNLMKKLLIALLGLNLSLCCRLAAEENTSAH